MDGVDVYSTAKSEYTEQFCIFLVPALQSYFLGLVDEAKEKEKDARRVLWVFQNLLKDIPDWNQDKVLRETEKISTSSKCDYLEELLTAVFIAHTKVLSAIRLSQRDKKKIQITVPKLEHFLHRTLSESARILWSNAYLFSEQGTSIERQKNLRQVEMLLHQAVLQSIRSMLPVKSILREYLNNDETEEEKPEEEVEEKQKPKAESEEEEDETEAPVQIDISGGVVPDTTPQAPPSTPEPPVESPASAATQVVTVASESINTEKPQATEETQPEVTPPPPAPAPVVASQPQQVLIFDTEPSVKFSEHVTVFDETNPQGTQVHMTEMKTVDGDGEEENDVGLEILDMPAEAVDDFEDLEGGRSSVTDLGHEDFETLA